MAVNIFPRVAAGAGNRWGPLRQGHWSTRGLKLCLPFGNAAPVNVASPTRIGSRVSLVGGCPQGAHFQSSNVLYNLVVDTRAQDFFPLNRVTVLCVRQSKDTTLRDGSLFGFEINTPATRLGAHVPYLDGTVYWDFGGNSLPNRISVAYSKTTQIERWVFVAGANGSAIWCNGTRLVSQSTAITRTGIASFFDINYGNGATGDFQDIHFFALLDAEWLPTQIAEWTANPWLMFARTSTLVDGPAAPTAVGRSSICFVG